MPFNWLKTVLQETLEKKMEIIASRIYGADGIELSEEARKKVELYTRQVTNHRYLQWGGRNYPELI